jgi:TRAP-type mannitol/chloroaromatic compound transport system permease small subunit
MNQFPSGLLRMVGVIDPISEWCGKLFAWLAVPLVAGVTYEVVARSAFNAPTIWSYEVTYMLYGSLFMLGAGFTLLKKEHIRLDMLYEKFTTRRKGTIDAVMYLCFFFPGMIFYFWAGLDEAMDSWVIRETSDASPWRPIVYPFKTVVPVAAALLIFQGVSEFIKSLHAAVTGRWPHE